MKNIILICSFLMVSTMVVAQEQLKITVPSGIISNSRSIKTMVDLENYLGLTLTPLTSSDFYQREEFPDINSNAIFGFMYDELWFFSYIYDLEEHGIEDKNSFFLKVIEQFNEDFGEVAGVQNTNYYAWYGVLYHYVSIRLSNSEVAEQAQLIIEVEFFEPR